MASVGPSGNGYRAGEQSGPSGPEVVSGPAPEPHPAAADATLRIAAAGDVHARESRVAETRASFERLAGAVDLVLLAGDLTMHGEAREAEMLAEATQLAGVPVFAVLGNHDWHLGEHDEIVGALTAAGVRVLERTHATCELNGTEVGVAGVKGFVGGFPGSHLPDFGEPLLRQVYAETTDEVCALDESLKAIALCSVRIALLHYAPTEQTLGGEPEGIWPFLGCDRMAAPILEHAPDLVLHGHAHSGRFEGEIGEVPVFNVSVPVIGRDFWLFELSGVEKTLTPIH
jgi:uncharacterized protein